VFANWGIIMRDNIDGLRDFIRYEILTNETLFDMPDRERNLVVRILISDFRNQQDDGQIIRVRTLPWCSLMTTQAAKFIEEIWNETKAVQATVNEIIFYKITRFGLFVPGPFVRELGRFSQTW